MHSVQCTVYCILYRVCCILYTVHKVQLGVYCIQCTARCWCMLHFIACFVPHQLIQILVQKNNLTSFCCLCRNALFEFLRRACIALCIMHFGLNFPKLFLNSLKTNCIKENLNLVYFCQESWLNTYIVEQKLSNHINEIILMNISVVIKKKFFFLIIT